MSAAADGGFVFKVSLAAEDCAQFFDLIARRQQQRIPMPRYDIIAFACALPVAIGAAVLARQTLGFADGWSVGLLCGAAYLIGMQATAWLARAAHRRLRDGVSEMMVREWADISITLDAHGIRVTGESVDFSWRWRLVGAVTVENGALMFWTGVSAVRIPERAFANSSERDAVIAYARRCGASA
jgi:hypothetical protein